MRVIVDHNDPRYAALYRPDQKRNGAYFYSKEIVENMIPLVETDRNWYTIHVPGIGRSHSIVFCHNNKNPALYEQWAAFRDVVLVCGVPDTVPRVAKYGRAIYLPLSIDVEYVSSFRTDKPKEYAYAYCGRPAKREGIKFPRGTVFLEGLPRPQMLRELSKARKVYAVGRCALEALAVGCEEILPYDPRFPDSSIWQLLDNRDAAKLLQQKLDEIDKENR